MDAALTTMEEKDRFWMRHALSLAKKAESEGEVPVGAVLVANDRMIAEGWNQTIQQNDPTAHAEVVALRKAGQALQNYRLPGLTLYVTLEPCPMCAGALVHSRIERLVVATKDPRTGAAGSLMNLVSHEGLNHQIETQFGVLEMEASELLTQFFRRKRAQAKMKRAGSDEQS
ncbi:MAG: tRNA adenosine(34) deaminase TadA [Hydrogenovibrio sp.]|nr:tRNA adenosine(34) deaminase TadA [Hydrogenovibrio sp.]